MKIDGRELSVRTLAHDGLGDCLDFFRSIPYKIFNFFCHRYADVRMFIRAFNSMGAGTTPSEIERRIQNLFQLRQQVLHSDGSVLSRVEIQNRFRDGIHNLLFYVDSDYIERLIDASRTYLSGSSTTIPLNSLENREIIEEIVRECDQAIAYQRMLTSVNTFYNIFSGNDSDHGNTWPSSYSAQSEPTRTGATRPGNRPNNAINLNIPGTVAYAQDVNNLPQEVRDKAQEIIDLTNNYFNLPEDTRPALPNQYECSVYATIISIPVFDASHPAVQNALRAAQAANATSADQAALNNRDLRHIMDKVALEAHFTASRNNHRIANCPACRHPVSSDIERRNLLVDTAFQDEILQFLRTVPGINNAVTT
jgi:hypothetical protein